MSLLIFSPKCNHCLEIIEFVKNHQQLKQLVHFHNVNTHGIPGAYAKKINRVPTLLTKNGKILVGREIKNWLESLLPSNDIFHHELGSGMFTFSLDGDDDGGIFSLDHYGQSLQPAMTRDLEEKINRNVSESYNDIKS
jgi:hypothetical protein